MKSISEILVGEIDFPTGHAIIIDPIFISHPFLKGDLIDLNVGEFFSNESQEPFQAIIELADTGLNGIRVENLLLLRENGRKTKEDAGIPKISTTSGRISVLDLAHVNKFNNDSEKVNASLHVSFSQACAEARGEFGYMGVCDLTLHNPNRGGLLDGRMFVTESGFGDGTYPVYVGRDKKGEVRSIRVSFLEALEGC